MKKILEKKDKSIIINLVFYILVCVMGIILMEFTEIGLKSTVLYISAIFFVFAFLAFIAYFVDRRPGNYEHLFLALTNVILGTFLYFLQNEHAGFILGTGVIIFTFCQIFTKGFRVYKLSEDKNNIWFIKFVITFIIAFLGILVTLNLYQEKTLQTLIFGYFFLAYGIINLLDPLYALLLKNKNFNAFMNDVLEDEKEPKEKVEKKLNINEKLENKIGQPKSKKIVKPTTKKAASKPIVKKKPVEKPKVSKTPAKKEVSIKKPTVKKVQSKQKATKNK